MCFRLERTVAGLLWGFPLWLNAAGVDFVIAQRGKPVCEIVLPAAASEVTRHAANRLRAAVLEAGGVRLPIVSESEAGSASGKILLGTLAENSLTARFLREKRMVVPLADREQASLKRALISENLGPEGFVIFAGESQGRPTLAVTAHTPIGGLYAVETLSDRVYREDDRVLVGPLNSDETPILNLPAFRVRSVATNLGGPDWIGGGQWEQEWAKGDGYDWRGFVDWLASHKINNLNAWIFNLAFGIAYDSKRFPEMVNRHHPNVRHEFMTDLISYAHSRGIKVFIMIDFPDNWTAVVKARPELAGKNFNPADIPSGEVWETYQKYGERRLGESGPESFRTKYSWVCGSEPKTLQFWREYLEDLLEHYPTLDGIGAQFSEHDKNICNCESCSRNHFAINEKFFAAMTEAGQRRNPQMAHWIYDSWGTRDIILHQQRYPNFVNIDWSGSFAPLYRRQYLPRSNWYLFHRSGEQFPEFTYQGATQVLNERGVEAMQIRGVAYKIYDNAYQAFEEFSWNPRLSIERYADQYIRKLYHRRDPQLSSLYAAWMNFLGYRELAGPAAGGVMFYENPYRSADVAKAAEAEAVVTRLLEQVQDRSQFVEAIRNQFKTRK
jgi:hypothetical protein